MVAGLTAGVRPRPPCIHHPWHPGPSVLLVPSPQPASPHHPLFAGHQQRYRHRLPAQRQQDVRPVAQAQHGRRHAADRGDRWPRGLREFGQRWPRSTALQQPHHQVHARHRAQGAACCHKGRPRCQEATPRRPARMYAAALALRRHLQWKCIKLDLRPLPLPAARTCRVSTSTTTRTRSGSTTRRLSATASATRRCPARQPSRPAWAQLRRQPAADVGWTARI